MRGTLTPAPRFDRKGRRARLRQGLRRRQAIEPAIGHTENDNRMDRCWLGGSSADVLHAVLCTAGFNIRRLLRAIAARGLEALLLLFSQVALHGARIGNKRRFASDTVARSDRRRACRRWPITPRLATG